MRPTLLGNLLKRSLQRAQLGVVVEAAMVVEAAQRIINERFGVDCCVTVRALKKGTLLMVAPSSAAVAEVSMQRNELIELVNKEFGHAIVKQVRFV